MSRFFGWKALSASILIAAIATLSLIIVKALSDLYQSVVEYVVLYLTTIFGEFLRWIGSARVFGYSISEIINYLIEAFLSVWPLLSGPVFVFCILAAMSIVLAGLFWLAMWLVTRGDKAIAAMWQDWKSYSAKSETKRQEKRSAERRKTSDISQLQSIITKNGHSLNGYNYHAFADPYEGPGGHAYSVKVDCLIACPQANGIERGLVVVAYKHASGSMAGRWVMKPADFDYLHHAVMLVPRGLIWRGSEPARTFRYFVEELGVEVPWYLVPVYSIAVFIDEYSRKVYDEKFAELKTLLASNRALSRESDRLRARQARWFRWRNNYVFIRTLSDEAFSDDRFFAIDASWGVRGSDIGHRRSERSELVEAVALIDGINRYLFDRERECEYSEWLILDIYDCIPYVASVNGNLRKLKPILSRRRLPRLANEIGAGFAVRNSISTARSILDADPSE